MAGFGDLMGIMGKVQELQGNMKKMQEELQKKSYEASSGGGMVTATVNGKGDLLNVKIDPQAVDPRDVEMLEDLVKAAITAAVTKSREEMKQELNEVTGGINLPGMDSLSGLLGL